MLSIGMLSDLRVGGEKIRARLYISRFMGFLNLLIIDSIVYYILSTQIIGHFFSIYFTLMEDVYVVCT